VRRLDGLSRYGSENPVTHCRIAFVWRSWKNGKWHIESRYPTQAKRRLEWGTQHFVAGVAKTMARLRPLDFDSDTAGAKAPHISIVYGPTKVVP
jgi:hypothetical protein